MHSGGMYGGAVEMDATRAISTGSIAAKEQLLAAIRAQEEKESRKRKRAAQRAPPVAVTDAAASQSVQPHAITDLTASQSVQPHAIMDLTGAHAVVPFFYNPFGFPLVNDPLLPALTPDLRLLYPHLFTLQ